MKAHFVTFLSPGTFMAEDTTKPIAEWCVETAVRMADDITERHNARPYGFFFSTRERADDELDSKTTLKSGIYYLGGVIETIADVEARNDPAERILLANMKGNGWERVITNRNSWKWTLPFGDGDTLLEYTPPPLTPTP